MQYNNKNEYFRIVSEILDKLFVCKVDENVFYSKNHLCLKEVEKDIYIVGFDSIISQFLSFVSTLVFTDYIERVEEGIPFGWLVQDGKTLSIPSPVSAIIVAHNKNIIDTPELIRNIKFPENWFVKLKIETDKAKAKLLSGNDAHEWYKSKIENLKYTLKKIIIESNPTDLVTLYDGGRIIYSISEILPKKENLKILVDLLGGK